MPALSPPLAVNSGDDELPTRASLFSRLKDHADHASWLEFFERYWQLIYRAAVREGLNDAEAQDVVQEVILRVQQQLPEFRYDPQKSFKGWLLRATHWRTMDQLRRRQRAGTPTVSPAPSVEEALPPELEAYWDSEWEAALWRAGLTWLKQQVSAEQYQIFDLHVLKGRPVLEVARALDVASPTVYVVKHRLLRLLKPELQRLRDQPL